MPILDTYNALATIALGEFAPDEAEDEAEQIIQKLALAGTLTLPLKYPDAAPPSDRERIELADRLGRAPGKPLSEIIIEERGQL